MCLKHACRYQPQPHCICTDTSRHRRPSLRIFQLNCRAAESAIGLGLLITYFAKTRTCR